MVVYPEGLPEDRERRASFSSNPRLWNDGSGRFNQDLDDIEFGQILLEEPALNRNQRHGALNLTLLGGLARDGGALAHQARELGDRRAGKKIPHRES